MKKLNDVLIIGIDHGYGNIKTENCVFATGVMEYDEEPYFKENLLVWNDKFYIIGENHKEFDGEKTFDKDYYILTLAAIARELNIAKTYIAKVRLAVGLPLTWVSSQKEKFTKYLMEHKEVTFSFKGKDYRVEITGVDVFPQGFAAVANNLRDFTGINMICDIGNGTMNVMYINDKKPVGGKCFTDKFGTNQCMILVKEAVMKEHHTTIDESLVTRVLRFGTADIAPEYLDTIKRVATGYVDGIFRRLREFEYNPKMMKLYIVGGGGCLINNFGKYDENRVTIIDDICATVKGYEYLAELSYRRSGGKA